MDAANFEFKELLDRSGWNQAEAARHIDLQPPSVSRYLKGQDTPSRQTLRLFRMVLDLDAPPLREKQQKAPEVPVDSELEIWKRRAIAAEKELESLKTSLRALSARSTPAPASNKALSEAQKLLNRASEQYDWENRHTAAGAKDI
jgi:transcriptional regulator with XRE-family HTH domain